MHFLGQVQMAPRPLTVYPGVQGRPPVAVPTRPGWPTATPPYVTYPVDKVAWGEMDPPPYQGTTYEPKTDLPPAARRPSAPKIPAPAPPPAIPRSAPTGGGPIPISDWFGLLKR